MATTKAAAKQKTIPGKVSGATAGVVTSNDKRAGQAAQKPAKSGAPKAVPKKA
jgi:hypothetical protein